MGCAVSFLPLVVVLPLWVVGATVSPFAEVEELEPWSFDAANVAKRAMSSSSVRGTEGDDVRLTVVTRSGFRPQCLANLRASLAAQVGVSFVHLISNDAGPEGRAAIDEQIGERRSTSTTSVVDVDRYDFNRGPGNKCYSTKYLKVLYRLAPANSWIVTLDDDARLVHPDQLLRVKEAAAAAEPTDVLLQDAFLGKHEVDVYPRYTPEYEGGAIPKIDTSNTIYHKSATDHLRWVGKCGGDKRLFLQLVQKNYTLKHIPTSNPGVWANYNGQAKQNLSNCEVIHLAPGERDFLRSPAYRAARVDPSPWLVDQAQVHYKRLMQEKKRKHTGRLPPDFPTTTRWRRRRGRRRRRRS